MPKIYVITLRKNTDIEFKRKKCKLNEVSMDWGAVTFESKDIFGRVRKLPIFHLPLWGWKKPYIVVREGDNKPITFGELPEVTQKQVEEWAKSKLIKTLGFETPRETPLIGIITLMLLMSCFILEILILSGVRIGG